MAIFESKLNIVYQQVSEQMQAQKKEITELEREFKNAREFGIA